MQQKNTIIWCMLTQIWHACANIFFCHFRPYFALLPHYWPQTLDFGKNVKKHGDIILLHMCTINQDHMIHGSWDMKFNRHNFFVILDKFLPFCPANTLKNENIKNEKKALEISFYTSVPKIMIICYTVLEIWCVTDVIIFHFGLFFALLPP